MSYKAFDRSKLKLRPLNQREHDLSVDQIPDLNAPSRLLTTPTFHRRRSNCTRQANNRAVIFMIGAHVIRSGAARYLMT